MLDSTSGRLRAINPASPWRDSRRHPHLQSAIWVHTDQLEHPAFVEAVGARHRHGRRNGPKVRSESSIEIGDIAVRNGDPSDGVHLVRQYLRAALQPVCGQHNSASTIAISSPRAALIRSPVPPPTPVQWVLQQHDFGTVDFELFHHGRRSVMEPSSTTKISIGGRAPALGCNRREAAHDSGLFVVRDDHERDLRDEFSDPVMAHRLRVAGGSIYMRTSII